MSYNIIDILEGVIAKTNQKLGLTDPKLMIKFEYGTESEVNNIITKETRGDGSYPLIWLVARTGDKSFDSFLYDYSIDLQLFYIDQTEDPSVNTKSKDIIKGQLSQMRVNIEMFLYCLAWDSKHINKVEGVYPFGYVEFDIPKIGRLDKDKNIFNDKCEGIEMRINNLQINFSNC